MDRERERASGDDPEDYDRELKDPTPSWRSFCLALFTSESFTSGDDSVVRNAISREPSSLLQRFVIHPANWWYVLWTHFIVICAAYSSFFTPLEFGFFRGLPEKLFLLDIANQIAFLIDIVVHFFVAYHDTDSYRLISSPNLIAIRYLKSRFLFDFLGCLPWDAIYKACGRKELVRYLLWIRLTRASRVTEFFEKLEKDIRINYLFIRIVKLFVVELYCTHSAACIFYYLATTVPPSHEGYTWIGSLKMGDYSYSNFREIDLWKRYTTCLYFAIVTMATLGYGDVHAVNVREMIFVMIYISFDMVLGAYLLGNITALIVKGSKTERLRDKMTDLIKYMNKNSLSNSMTKEIKSHFWQLYGNQSDESAILQDIPASIRTKISQKLYEPYIKEVSLFRGCSSEFIKKIAIQVHEENFLPGEVIIEQGSVTDQLYIVCHGDLVEVGKGENDEEELHMHLKAYSSFGEVSFLCNSPQPYAIQVRELCRVLRLEKQSFMDILGIYFYDGRIILNNLLEGKNSHIRNKLLESDVTIYIEKHELEQATRLNCAVNEGDFHRLKRLIRVGADPNKTDYDGRSPLHIAASKGYEDITGYLVEKGVDINVSDNFGNTPLLEAVKNGHDQVASLLFNAGASLTIDDEAGDYLCSIVSKKDVDLLKRILAYGINPNARNYDYRTALHIAASGGLFSISELLIEAGASVFPNDRWGNTPLDEARLGGNKNLINLLEVARTSQMSQISSSALEIRDELPRKCTVFPFNPFDLNEERRQGVVLWVPQTMQELISTAREQLKCSAGSHIILSENGGKIIDLDMISDEQKLFLVPEDLH